MRPKADPVSEIASLFLEKDEVGQMMLDNLFSTVDLQIDLAQARIARGERSAVVVAAMRDAMRRLRRASYETRRAAVAVDLVQRVARKRGAADRAPRTL